MTAKALGFDAGRPTTRSTRLRPRFRARFLMAAIASALHLSRLAEEFVIWASQQFGFVRCPMPFHRQLDHAAEAQPRCGGAGARPSRPDHGLH
jgi:hypothetical protein